MNLAMPMNDDQGRPCGYLEIDETDKRKKFQRRYFIVDLNCRLIKWFKDSPLDQSGESSPCGCINVDYITKVDVVNKFKLSYCFVINTPFRPYYALASNEQELKEWVEVLNDAGKIVVPPEEVRRLNARYQSKACIKSTETQEAGVTYRTDIVAGVVQKKKIASEKLKFDEIPPSPTSAGSFTFDTSSENDLSKSNVSGSSNNILKQGWGIKRGHVRKNWKRRYFILYSNGFSYYKSDKDDEAIRTIPIDEILTAKVGSEENSDSRENLFMVATTDKIYYVQVDSSEEMSSWVSNFEDALKTYRKENSQRLHDDKIGERFANHHQIFKSSSFKGKVRSKFQF